VTDEWEWFVVMYRVKGDFEEHRLGPFASEDIADRADAKLIVNMDRAHFYTRVMKRQRRSSLKALGT
jgi:hypothetical protein